MTITWLPPTWTVAVPVNVLPAVPSANMSTSVPLNVNTLACG